MGSPQVSVLCCLGSPLNSPLTNPEVGLRHMVGAHLALSLRIWRSGRPGSQLPLSLWLPFPLNSTKPNLGAVISEAGGAKTSWSPGAPVQEAGLQVWCCLTPTSAVSRQAGGRSNANLENILMMEQLQPQSQEVELTFPDLPLESSGPLSCLWTSISPYSQ